MEEKLKEILNNHVGMIDRYKSECDRLISRMEFCQEHNFKEEERITRLEYDAIHMIVYNYGMMYKELQDMLDKWLS